jgi:N-acetylmuramoyl-L-alanine amidase
VTGASVIASRITISVVGGRTRLAIDVSQPVAAQAYVLADPPRLVVDAADLDFQIEHAPPAAPTGLANGYRYGLLAPGRSRLVVDLTGPARITRTEISPASPTQHASFALELEATSMKSFQASAEKVAAAPLAPADAPHTKGSAFEDAVEWPRVASGRPLIMIDPGHGGIDPGALSAGVVREKDVVLSVARQLAAVLSATGHYEVRLTRSGDVFVPLDQRIEMSRAAGAALFISIHADSIDTGAGAAALAQTVRGATVYTLSETASNRDAQALADKENAADALAGVSSPVGGDNHEVKGILIDLMKRETQNFALEARGLLVQNMRSAMTMARDPARSAAFKVLRQSQAPAVLIELGYMSHAQDVALLQSADWQKGVAKAITAAINSYFARRVAQTP